MKKDFPLYHKDIYFVNPGGESFKQLYDRLIPFIDKLSHEKGIILIVAHAGCIRAMYSYIVGEDFQHNINMQLGHDSIIRCELNGPDMSAEFLKD